MIRRLSDARQRVPIALGLEVVVVVTAYMAYEAVRRAIAPHAGPALSHGRWLVEIEQRLGFFWERALQQAVVHHPFPVTLLNWVYVWGYLPVIGAVAVWLFLRHRALYARYRNAFLLSGAAGLLVFALWPVAPPRLLPDEGFVDTVRLYSRIYNGIDGSGYVNQFAAVPSFHFGWILLIAIAIWQTTRNRLARLLAAALPVAMLASIVLTGNHYFFDALAGGALVLLALGAVTALERLAQGRRAAPDLAPGPTS